MNERTHVHTTDKLRRFASPWDLNSFRARYSRKEGLAHQSTCNISTRFHPWHLVKTFIASAAGASWPPAAPEVHLADVSLILFLLLSPTFQVATGEFCSPGTIDIPSALWRSLHCPSQCCTHTLPSACHLGRHGLGRKRPMFPHFGREQSTPHYFDAYHGPCSVILLVVLLLGYY